MFGQLAFWRWRAPWWWAWALGAPVFGAAWLLFAIEPMFAKSLLPALGGTPATWAACVVAFQLLLLCGYGYAHLGARFLEVRWQAVLHTLCVLIAGVSLLSMRIAAAPDLRGLPLTLAVPWLVLQRLGLPYALLASTTPLLSRWAKVLGRGAGSLYAVSNAGALLGLLTYPLLLERFVALPVQLALWAAGFVLFGLSLLPLCWWAARSTESRGRPTGSSSLPRGHRVRWLLYSAVPSALLLAVTNHLTVDVAAAPLFWVVPLALYLASFVIAFSAWNRNMRGFALALWLVGALWLSLNAFAQGAASLGGQIGAALLALFGACLFCHGELGRARPEGEPTGFFLIMASGGVLGGIFVSVVAPFVFSDFYELEVASLATFLLLLDVARRPGPAGFERPARLLLYLGCGVCVPLLGAETLVRHSSSGRAGHVVERRRGFLGPLRVVDTVDGRILTHGRIQHGMQLRAPALRRTPTMYFARGTAIARVLDGVQPDHPRRLGVVGLGVGTLASYARAGESMRFYELDPNVIELSRRDFSFVSDSPANVTIVEGDGRLLLAREVAHAFDVLVLDAFASDAVPVHLLTREAFEVYVRQLAPTGLLLANVSNRHLAVDRVVRASARAVGLHCEIVETMTSELGHVSHVVWAVMAEDPAILARVLGTAPRKPASLPDVLWTDSRASVLSVLR